MKSGIKNMYCPSRTVIEYSVSTRILFCGALIKHVNADTQVGGSIHFIALVIKRIYGVWWEPCLYFTNIGKMSSIDTFFWNMHILPSELLLQLKTPNSKLWQSFTLCDFQCVPNRLHIIWTRWRGWYVSYKLQFLCVYITCLFLITLNHSRVEWSSHTRLKALTYKVQLVFGK